MERCGYGLALLLAGSGDLKRTARGPRSRERNNFLDIYPHSRYICLLNLAREGRGLETHLDMERVRFPRAGLVTPLPGGPGIVPAGMTTGARGAPLKRE